MSKLPSSWVLSTFGELNRFESKTLDPSARPNEIFELYSVPSFPTAQPERITGSQIGSIKQVVDPDDVLVCKINPRINRIWRVGPKRENELIASSEWIVFRSEALLPRFAGHYFNSLSFRELLCSEVSGIGGSLTRAQPKKVATYPVPVAPLDEQTRIADQLDKLLARIQACNDRLDAIPALLKRFRQAVLATVTSGELTEDWRSDEKVSTKWSAVQLSDVLVEMRNGLSAKPSETPPGAKILRISSVRAGRLNLADHRFLDVSETDAVQYSLQENDLLFTRYNGSLEFVGVCALVRDNASGYVYPDKLIRVRVDESKANPKFIEIIFSSENIRKQIESFIRSSAGQKGISGADLKGTQFMLPPLTEQAEIVHRVKALFNLADRIEARYTAALAQAQRLTPLLLAKAFRGALVPQDPSDEPASTLLKRIADERAKTAAQPRPHKSTAGRKPVRARKENAAMTKSRQDDDVQGQPYLARHLRLIGGVAQAEVLFKASELPVADFYKQLAWEVAQGHLRDGKTVLELGDAA